MQRILLLLVFSFFAFNINAQDPIEANMLGNWQNPDLPSTSWLNSIYNEVWGVTVNDYEIGIIGSTMGVHFIDVTDPATMGELPNTFVEGKATGTDLVHRDYHDYNGYLYAVADEGPSSLQIIDLSDLPNSTNVVYDSDEFIIRAHNIFIDENTEKLYAMGGLTPTGAFSLLILSLEDPENPELVARYPNSQISIPNVHDGYFKDDIAYLNCGNNGFYVVDLTDPADAQFLGTMTDYPQQGYNHSGWLHPTEPIYYMADETHGMDLKVVDVSDFSDIEVIHTFNAGESHPAHIPHNLIVKGDYLYVSYYYDGLQVFDISDPIAPVRVQFYDTYPGQDTDFFHGAWGVFPFFESDNILVSDMQSGLYLIEFGEEIIDGVEEIEVGNGMNLFPQPVQSELNLVFNLAEQTALQVNLLDLNGKLVQTNDSFEGHAGNNQITLDLEASLPNGIYLLQVRGTDIVLQDKVLIQR